MENEQEYTIAPSIESLDFKIEHTFEDSPRINTPEKLLSIKD